MSPSRVIDVVIRRAKPEDAAACGAICYEAFRTINAEHGFPPEIPSAEVAANLFTTMFSHPRVFGVIAEADGRVVGSNCMDERSAIRGIGPITIDGSSQNLGIGRKLMEVVLARAREGHAAGVRLVQSSFHNRSLSLYATLGFDAREPLSVMQGPPILKTIEDRLVRPAHLEDLDSCNRICRQVHGHDRAGELSDAIERGSARVVERQSVITGYTSGLAFFGHCVGESNIDIHALIASAESFGGPGIIVPTRNAALFRWCLANGLRIVEPLTLMTMGLYSEPAGAYLPSISF